MVELVRLPFCRNCQRQAVPPVAIVAGRFDQSTVDTLKSMGCCTCNEQLIVSHPMNIPVPEGFAEQILGRLMRLGNFADDKFFPRFQVRNWRRGLDCAEVGPEFWSVQLSPNRHPEFEVEVSWTDISKSELKLTRAVDNDNLDIDSMPHLLGELAYQLLISWDMQGTQRGKSRGENWTYFEKIEPGAWMYRVRLSWPKS